MNFQVRVLAGAIACSVIALSSASAENVLRWSSAGDALTMDPHAQNEGPTIAMGGQIHERLIHRDPELKLEAQLATSWEVVEPTVWEFKLREGVTFHDGSDFNAEDVAFSIERAQAETSDFKEQVKSIAEVKIIDDHTVQFITDGPNPLLPNELTSVMMMDKQWAEANGVPIPQDFEGGEETFAVRNANGTGPFMIEERRPDELTVLRRNENWWGNDSYPVNVDKIEYRPIANAATRVAALLSGELDFVLDPPLQDLKRIESQEGLKVLTVSQDRTIFLGMDQASEELRSSSVKGANPLADVRVRQAINMSIDRAAIQRVVMEGLSIPAGIITAAVVNGSTPELDTPATLDVETAKGLLAEAGYPEGFDIQLDCPNDRYINDEKICQAVVAMLARIGIQVKLEAIPKAQHFPKIPNRETDFYMLGWGVPPLDSHYVFSYLFHKEGSWNATGLDNARANELIEAMSKETDLEARNGMIAEVWEIVKGDTTYIPLHHQVLVWAQSEKLDLPIAADDAPRFRYAVINP